MRTIVSVVGQRVEAADVAAVEEDQIGGDKALPELHRPQDLVGADDDAVAQRVLGLGVEAAMPGDVDDAVVVPEELAEQPGRLSLGGAAFVLVDARVDDEAGLSEHVGNELGLLSSPGEARQIAGRVTDDERMVGDGPQDLPGDLPLPRLQLAKEPGP